MCIFCGELQELAFGDWGPELGGKTSVSLQIPRDILKATFSFLSCKHILVCQHVFVFLEEEGGCWWPVFPMESVSEGGSMGGSHSLLSPLGWNWPGVLGHREVDFFLFHLQGSGEPLKDFQSSAV